jgi:hypothetical protein
MRVVWTALDELYKIHWHLCKCETVVPVSEILAREIGADLSEVFQEYFRGKGLLRLMTIYVSRRLNMASLSFQKLLLSIK